jgi:hypothetical protein
MAMKGACKKRMLLHIVVALTFLRLEKVCADVALVKSLGVTPAILSIDRSNGERAEVCLANFHVPNKRLPKKPDGADARLVSGPVVDLMPWDGCPSAMRHVVSLQGQHIRHTCVNALITNRKHPQKHGK